MTTASQNTDARPNVTVIGLGEMGSALAGAFLAGGHRTTVWNRTPEKTDPVVAGGAVRTGTVRDAVAASPLVVVSVQGNAAAREVLETAGDVLAGRAVVNLTDGTSEEARAVAEWVEGQGARYLHGQIMTIAPGIGGADTVIFYGGSGAVFDRWRPTIGLLGGRSALVSADAGAPTLYGMAVHGTMWGTLNGFLHAAALLTSEGIEVKRFLDDAGPSVAALLGSLPVLADEVDRGTYATKFGSLQHHRPSVEDLVRESRARHIDTVFPGYTLSLVERALADGHADDSYSRLIEHFRKPRP
ncbi:NAD(P)-binding domain-containing protein [Streptomyces sp. NBC_01433]|uniref:NAD(P)-dependent oxidoreductase n=1 Tax=Streptomyces sp. NBC_01433 TaxID=2903864 RepID=UPI0022543EA7|nr:NAD(P)-binding domain-containing protein [Streptomyces sp. NBC_01433]MCX4680279.1 NAD(P)-binding domain-containing protein [Streptomyces sp. NBC_01433]